MDELQLKRQRRNTGSGDRSARRSQAKRTAREAKEAADRRRAKESGLSGWVSERASQWTLGEPDWGFFETQKYFWNPLMDYWFRMEVEGWDNLPDDR
jgi:hypothetical protein